MPEAADRSLATAAAEIIAASFQTYVDRFRRVTLDARGHFERRDWHSAQRDSKWRLDLYGESVTEGLLVLRALLGAQVTSRATWNGLREAFASRIAGRTEVELAESFFNSFTRRIFLTVGVDPAVEFVASASSAPPCSPPWSLTVRFDREGRHVDLYRRVLEHFRFAAPWRDAEADAAAIATRVEQQVGEARVRGLELARAVFHRGKGAYIVGVIRTDGPEVPFMLALRHPEGGIEVDAVLLTADEVSVVFSFARSYFLVDMERPRELVDFLRSIMPSKPVAELYNAIGCNKHGKTELYRSLLHHLETSSDRFEVAPGARGMVMCVFTLPGFDVVFKVIRDRFEFPKTVTHQEVRDKYRLVFHHDRAGRLVDAQEFDLLEFDAARFSAPLLRELTTEASESVTIRDGRVVLGHLYTERRLRPLDIYLRETDPEAAREAVIDYGQVMRDLAATVIFPGDMLLKNFGVSRHGRLIFYDYDELCPLSECRFRILPTARRDEEETAQEPWYFVGERDIFPEQFRNFLGLKGELLAAFLEHHGELLEVEFWHRMQELHRRGEILDIYPYKSARRLRPPAPETEFPSIPRS